MLQRLFITLSLLIYLPIALQAQQGGLKAVLINGPVYMIQGTGAGNIGIISQPSSVIVIDAMMANSADQIRTALKAVPGGSTIRFLINTHWHSDHTDGNAALGAGSTIVAHENVRPLLEKPQTLMGQTTKALPIEALPSITYSEKLTLYSGDVPVRLVHYAHAHTNGDTMVFIDKYKVLHMGDMFFNGLFPVLDVDYGGDIPNWVRQLDAILADLPADTKIIPGHGPLAGVEDLKAFRQMLSSSAEIVSNQIKDGKTLDQIKTAGLPDSFAPWTKGGFLTTPQWLELVYRSLKK